MELETRVRSGGTSAIGGVEKVETEGEGGSFTPSGTPGEAVTIGDGLDVIAGGVGGEGDGICTDCGNAGVRDSDIA